jgi:hypothetical protein
VCEIKRSACSSSNFKEFFAALISFAFIDFQPFFPLSLIILCDNESDNAEEGRKRIEKWFSWGSLMFVGVKSETRLRIFGAFEVENSERLRASSTKLFQIPKLIQTNLQSKFKSPQAVKFYELLAKLFHDFPSNFPLSLMS